MRYTNLISTEISVVDPPSVPQTNCRSRTKDTNQLHLPVIPSTLAANSD